MSTPRTLSYLHCTPCNEITLHDYNRCPQCKTLNTMTHVPPMPTRKEITFGQTRERHKKRIDGIAARNRARQARNKILAGMGVQ